ncbi:MAG: serine hydrolase [Clostridiaceae bacterium]|nr:serine hydrolase [Clostridiaceae bacterium]
MMKNAEAVLAQKRASGEMESYAFLVSIDGKECLLTSPDADRDTYFDVASAGKILVTTQLVLKAIDEDRLALTDTLDKFFSHVPDEKKSITLQQLLTHTSGIVRTPIPAEICARNNDVIAAHILSAGLAFAPGTDFVYSCAGMMLVGFILEKLYAMTLDELFFVKIKHPLGIDRMRFNIAVDEENAAVCYQREEAGLRSMDDWTVVLLRNGVSGAGGSFWSIHAVDTLVKAIMAKDKRLYSSAIFDLAEQIYTPELEEKRGLGYQFDNMKGAVDLGRLFSKGSFGHCGWTGASVFMNRAKTMYAIALSNTRRCMVRKYPDSYGIDKSGNDMVYMQLRDVFDAIKTDLDETGLIK